MFTHSIISTLNDTEMQVYNTVIKSGDKVMYMTIRELADAAGVSTTSVLRFCRKMQCDGYSEFRIRFKLYLEQEQQRPINYGVNEMVSFFKSINNDDFEYLISQAVEHILAAQRIIFIGAGTSGTLGKYGARFFSNVGKFSNYIDDPYYPVSNDMYKDAVAIILSISGETEEILRLASQFSLHRCKIITITNSETSSLAKLADFNISCHMPLIRMNGGFDITTQVPTLYIIESIGRKLASRLSE
ncbi:MAG: MurR/RpiR family transcriptional regulator [Mixta calida]|jgi:DNA-binding MurR/RpiR family transcriptional regulator|uniref:MurR/RpiR family transcriptional regulator n=2 Tax=Mixta calida TaxID=665913 RepID=A0ABM6S407_9GAMM|nr:MULTISPECIES: MurR/RpiR family transcriptional regulator [Mixta]AIX72652.1 transcriptional regulator [Pantoea sp. PSNIH2]MBS6059725.1 MurR/RpiR family transcriptional regulator [Pantoea sp.]POU52125.1 MurR/RpiR family transcriptional regulator [Pantoea sp. PSNIH5]POU69624.1 MurR/RpiR family transcriptional regulator [Pantoea sp. PSNIH4]POY69715.1 MurR/RpiR family transcriptional regulator [Pantoea sp. PSNIH3]HCW45838.1 MurR/RpiR family transcriptional regulator [Erwiniaceae bacterium]